MGEGVSVRGKEGQRGREGMHVSSIDKGSTLSTRRCVCVCVCVVSVCVVYVVSVCVVCVRVCLMCVCVRA